MPRDDDSVDIHLELGILDRSMSAVYRKGILRQTTPSLTALLDNQPLDREAILEKLSMMSAGCRPLLLSRRVFLASCLIAKDSRIVSITDASRLDLDEWLEGFHGRRPGVLIDRNGNILAMTETAGRIFSEYGSNSLGETLDAVSSAAFTTAAEKCLKGEQVRDFTALTRESNKGRRSLLVSLQQVGAGGMLLVVSFSTPSLAMTAFAADDTRLVRTIFSTIPIPAARIDQNGIVTAVNSHASRLAANAGLKDPVSTSFLDWIFHSDRPRVESLHRNRMEGRYAPFRFRANLVGGTSDSGQLFEVTSILMPDCSSTMVFFMPVEKAGEEMDFLQTQPVRELTDLISGYSRETDFTNTMLEFVRLGTGASGAVYTSRGQRTTIGDAPLSPTVAGAASPDQDGWSEDSMGLSLTISTGKMENEGSIRLIGIPSRTLDPIGELAVGLAPVLADYTRILGISRNSNYLFSSLSDFIALLKARDRDLRLVLERLAAIMGADYLAIHTISPREPVLQPLMAWGINMPSTGLPLEIPSIASWVYTHSETCYVPDTAVDQRFSSIFPTSRSELAVPLMIEGKGRGTLVAGSESLESFEKPSPKLLETLAMMLSLWLFGGRAGAGGERIGQERDTTHHIGLEDLLQSLSHRIRAPITTLRSHTDLLASGKLGRMEEAQLDSLREMNIALVDLVEYAERMLTFMKIELQGDKLENAWIRPSDVVSSMLPILSEKAGHRGISLSAELPSDPFTANVDRSMLEQITGNLVNNAIHFSRENGSVSISVREDDAEHWSLEVFNTGEGIPSEDLPHVFDRFFTGSNIDSSSRGLGIGLAIVKSFAEQMGGTVNTRSRTGYGTWFTVRFPLT